MRKGLTGPVTLQVLLARERLRSKTGRNVRVRFLTTAASTGRLTVIRGGKVVVTYGQEARGRRELDHLERASRRPQGAVRAATAWS